MIRRDPAARGPLEEADLQQVRLRDVLDRVRLLAESGGQARDPDRSPAELLDQRAQDLRVQRVQPELVHVEQLEGGARDVSVDHAGGFHLCVVTDPPQQPVGYTRCPARPARDFLGAVALQRDVQDARAATDDRLKLVGGVVVQARAVPEAVSQRPR